MANKTTVQSKHEIAQAAEDAVKVISNAASEALKVSSLKTSEDHDLLIRIATQVEQVIKDVGDLKTNTVKRIDDLELNSISKVEHEKVTTRLDKLENWKNWILGVGVIVSSLATFLAVALFNHLVAK